jgi:hypothetical protein
MTERIRVRTDRRSISSRRRRKKLRVGARIQPVDVAERIRQRRDRLLETMAVAIATRINELRIGSFYELVYDPKRDRR